MYNVRLTACALAIVVLSACGDGGTAADDTQSPSPTPTSSSLTPATGVIDSTPEIPSTESTVAVTGPTKLVIERRAMTDVERERLDHSEPPPLDCDDVGEAFWDYGDSPEPGTPGRTADDALIEVINDFNEEARSDPRTTLDYDYVPVTGWIELTDGGSSTFVHTTGNWRFAVQISGDPVLNNWRPSGALLCQPDGGGVPPQP